jgi:hypothetical protein
MLATTNKGDLVLDPFFGTGTTGAVAKRLGRDWLGCEREPSYIEVAEERIEMALPLDESALTTMQSKRSAPKVAFGQLVESGWIAPGAQLSTRSAASWPACAPTGRSRWALIRVDPRRWRQGARRAFVQRLDLLAHRA